MPDTEERAGNRSCRTEVEQGKRCGEPRVLHADLDGDRLDLCHIHVECLCYEEAEGITKEIVAHDNDHDESTRLDDAACVSRDNTTDDEDDRRHGDERENLDGLLDRTLKEVVDEKAEEDRGDDNLCDGDHHLARRNVNPLPCEPEREERCHDRRENGGRHGHADGKSDITAREVGHDVRGRSTGAGADENDTGGKLRRKGKCLCQDPCEERHDAELGNRSDKNVARTLQNEFKVGKTQRHSHTEHDDAEQNRDPWNAPEERPWLKESDACDDDNKDRHIA